jgi:hypothetical protein
MKEIIFKIIPQIKNQGKPGSEFLTHFVIPGFLKENLVKNLLPGKIKYRDIPVSTA